MQNVNVLILSDVNLGFSNRALVLLSCHWLALFVLCCCIEESLRDDIFNVNLNLDVQDNLLEIYLNRFILPSALRDCLAAVCMSVLYVSQVKRGQFFYFS